MVAPTTPAPTVAPTTAAPTAAPTTPTAAPTTPAPTIVTCPNKEFPVQEKYEGKYYCYKNKEKSFRTKDNWPIACTYGDKYRNTEWGTLKRGVVMKNLQLIL